ncbi:MAG: YigZ family protein [Mucinivorans sp.]
MNILLTEDTFLTISAPCTGAFREKGSRFLAFAYPVQSTDHIERIIDELKTQYFDARHHCWAYRLGPQGEHYRTNDDGEPTYTAGKPILGQLLSRSLTNILVVVVRYIGGTKLGVPGLIEAYRCATRQALDQAMVVEKTIEQIICLTFEFASINSVMRIIKQYSPTIVEQNFDNQCSMKLSIRCSQHQELQNKLSAIETVSLL